jgi:hypothetical protein
MIKHVQNLHFDAKAVRQYVANRFSLDRMVQDYLGLYRDVLAETTSARVA